MTSAYRPLLKLQALALAALVLAISPSFAATYNRADIGKLRTVRVDGRETLDTLAEKYKIGYAQLLAANPGIDPRLPGDGLELVLPEWHLLPDTAHHGLVMNVGELRIYYFPPDGSEPMTFPIGIGREGLSTPLGTTTVVDKKKDPVWRPTPRMRQEDPRLPEVVPAGPDNPLGAYALYLGWPSYRIHGTNHEKAIGRRASSGCIRMYKPHITWVYQNVPVGTRVTSVNQPVKMAWIGNEFYIEAEPTDSQVDEIEYQNRQVTVQIPDGIIGTIRRRAGRNVSRIDWENVRKVLVQRTGIPTAVTHPLPGSRPRTTRMERREIRPAPTVTRPVRYREMRQAPQAPQTRQVQWDNLNTD